MGKSHGFTFMYICLKQAWIIDKQHQKLHNIGSGNGLSPTTYQTFWNDSQWFRKFNKPLHSDVCKQRQKVFDDQMCDYQTR